MTDQYPFISEILFTKEEIEAKVKAMAAQISADYGKILEPGESIFLMGALKGVFIFMADLCRAMTVPVTIHFIDVGHMEHHTRTTGIVEVEDQIISAIRDQHVLLLEDIVDAGLTLNYLVRSLNLASPKSVTVATLFSKEQKRLIDTTIKYTGFEIGNHYVVGYGLDYKEQFRNLPFLGVLAPDARE